MTNINSSNLVVFCSRQNCIYCFSCIVCCIKKHWREVVDIIVFVHCRRNQHFCIVEKYKQKRRGIQHRYRTNKLYWFYIFVKLFDNHEAWGNRFREPKIFLSMSDFNTSR